MENTSLRVREETKESHVGSLRILRMLIFSYYLFPYSVFILEIVF